MAENGVDGLLVSMDDVEHPRRQPCLRKQSGHEIRGRRIALRRLQNERVAAGDGDGEHPHGHHRGEVERRDAGAYPQGLAHGIHIDTRCHVVGERALQQMGNAAGELDDFEPPGNGTHGIGVHLAVLGGDDACQGVHVVVQESLELEHDAGPSERRGGGPFRKGFRRGGNRRVDVRRRGQGHAGREFTGRRIVDLGKAVGRPLHEFPTHVMAQCLHVSASSLKSIPNRQAANASSGGT